MGRLIAYIDGYNLYRGIKARISPQRPSAVPWPPLLWIDLPKLIKAIVRDRHELVYTYYFTARTLQPEESKVRQNTYLEALNTLENFEICYGRFLQDPDNTCHQCGHIMYATKEKMTDVSMALRILTDAYEDNFDVALLVTGDTDQVPTIRAVKRHIKPVFVAFPPERHNDHLEHEASAVFRIGKKMLMESLLPDPVYRTGDGFELKNPWPLAEEDLRR